MQLCKGAGTGADANIFRLPRVGSCCHACWRPGFVIANKYLKYVLTKVAGCAQVVLDSLLSLQPAAAAAKGRASREETVAAIATDLLDQVPPPFNLEQVMKAKADDPSALHVVLFQEVERYNVLLVRVRRSCAELLRGIQGLVVMSSGAALEYVLNVNRNYVNQV